jgi:hypothetical protein
MNQQKKLVAVTTTTIYIRYTVTLTTGITGQEKLFGTNASRLDILTEPHNITKWQANEIGEQNVKELADSI